MYRLYVVSVLPGSVETQGEVANFVVYGVFLPVSTGTKSIKIDREKPEL